MASAALRGGLFISPFFPMAKPTPRPRSPKYLHGILLPPSESKPCLRGLGCRVGVSKWETRRFKTGFQAALSLDEIIAVKQGENHVLFESHCSAAAIACLPSLAQPPLPATTPHVNQFELLQPDPAGPDVGSVPAGRGGGRRALQSPVPAHGRSGGQYRERGPVHLHPRSQGRPEGPRGVVDHFPPRTDGPNGQSCVACHNQPVEDGGGTIVSNINRDPFVRRSFPISSGAMRRMSWGWPDRSCSRRR